MNKIITIVLLTFALVYLFKRWAAGRNLPRDSEKTPGQKNPGKTTKAAEDMVRCQTCSVNLPRSEAILSQGRFYCCDEHRRSDA